MNQSALALIHPPQYKSGAPNRTRAALAIMRPKSWSEKLYRQRGFMDVLSEYPKEVKDLFFSLNAFGKHRRIEHLAQLNALYVDIDPMKVDIFGYNQELLMEYVNQLIPHKLPPPNILVSSGTGSWLIWLLEPTPAQALPTWNKVEAYFVDTLKHLGADPKCKDVTRVMRVPGSINSKTNRVVEFKVLHENRYRLDDLARQGFIHPKPSVRKVPIKSQPRQTMSVHPKFFTLYSLHHAIIQDLQTLANLRGRDLVGYREYFLFIWRNCLARLGVSVEDSDRQLKSVALQYLGKKPLPDREWMRTTMSVYRAKHLPKNAQPDCDQEETGYTLKASWIIENLGITPEEQTAMKVLIGKAEKYRRKNDKRHKVSRDQYLEKVVEQRELVFQLKQEKPNLSIREIAQELNIPKSSVHRYLKGFNHHVSHVRSFIYSLKGSPKGDLKKRQKTDLTSPRRPDEHLNTS
jgi:predicted DNA-binding protein YlxM (UPF0122 family)